MSSAPSVSSVETDLAIATRRLMQAEASVSQAEARVLQQWNMVQAILAKQPKQLRAGELESAQAALKFAERAHARAEAAYTEAKLDKAKAKADAAASAHASSASASSSTSAPNAICDSCRPFAAGVQSKRRHATGDEDNDEYETGDLDSEEEDHRPSGKRSKSSSSSEALALATSIPPSIEMARADMATQV
jgi:hypothetical protein